MKFSFVLYALLWVLRFTAWRHPAFRERLKERNLTAQFLSQADGRGRWFRFQDGRIHSGAGVKGQRRGFC